MAIKSHGTTVSISGSTIGGLTSIIRSGADKNMIETTNHESTGGFKEFIPGLKDGGTLELSGQYLIADAGQIVLRAASDDIEEVEITLVDGTVIAFEGYIISPGEEIPLDDAVTFSASIKITGPVTHTAGV